MAAGVWASRSSATCSQIPCSESSWRWVGRSYSSASRRSRSAPGGRRRRATPELSSGSSKRRAPTESCTGDASMRGVRLGGATGCSTGTSSRRPSNLRAASGGGFRRRLRALRRRERARDHGAASRRLLTARAWCPCSRGSIRIRRWGRWAAETRRRPSPWPSTVGSYPSPEPFVGVGVVETLDGVAIAWLDRLGRQV
jgi:hypothetical protein